MPRWEYKNVRAKGINPEQMKRDARDVQKVTKREVDWITHNRLDRHLNWDNTPTSPGNYGSERRVAWSERGCWTLLSQCLAELGDQCWELIGVTPALKGPSTDVSFDLLFKQP